MARVSAEPSAAAHAERVLALVGAASRIGALLLPASALVSGVVDVQRPVLGLVLGLVTVESFALAGGYLALGRVPAAWALADAAFLAGLMWLGAQPGLTGTQAPWRGLYGFATIAVAGYALPAWPLGAALAGAALLGAGNLAPAYSHPANYPLWNGWLDSLALLDTAAMIWVIAWLLRGSARTIDAHRMAAIERARALAGERERARQGAVLGAQLLSTLEDVAEEALDPVVAEQVRREVRWLRAVAETGLLDDDGDFGGNLGAGLRALVAEKAVGGLRVHLSLPADLPVPGMTGTRALLGAVREALTNVAKHAGTGSAEVRVRVADGGVEVVVADAGLGYDPGRISPGTGQRQSIMDRVAEARGCATVDSAPHRGTRVRLWVPA